MNLVDWLWTLLVIFFMVMFFIIFFMVVVDLFNDHSLGGGAKALWVIFLIFFPPLAVLIYLVARGNSMAERRQAKMQQAHDAQAAYIKQVAASGPAPADQIATAKALLDSGAISAQEFDTLKAKALA